MARIAFAWELGGEFGHAMACSVLARALHARGHHIGFIFRELHQLAFIADTSEYDVFQAPVSLTEGQGSPVPASAADILLGVGYADPAHLTGLVGAWAALFQRWKPDLVVADFAPTALLAARALRLKRTSYGNGFATPPQLSPLPAFRYEEQVPPQRLLATDAKAFAAANAALSRFAAPPLRNLAEQFETDEDFLATFPELDSYGNRPQSGYWGPRFSIDAGVSVHWPAGNGQRVFVYVKKSLPQLDALIAALAQGPHRVIAFIPELDKQRAEQLRGPQRIASERPVRLAPLLKDCDLFVSTGGNVCVGTLMSGVPQLVFPQQYEQYITAKRIEQLGAGLALGMKAPPAQVGVALNRLLREPGFIAAARAYARRYPAYSPAEQQRRMVMRIEEIIAAPSRWEAASPAGAILSPTSAAPGAPQ